MAKDLKYTFLLDFYGEMLTERQRELIDSYYNADLSLSELSEEFGITRQGIRDSIKRSEKELNEMEERLGLAKRFSMVTEALTEICDCAIRIRETNAGRDETIEADALKILEKAKALYD